MSKLVIVESPAKVKRLATILGDGWVVETSRGAVRDLPEKELGIDIQHDFQPQFGIAKDKRGVVSRLKRAIKKADVVYIATDPDREGETIGWHVLDLAQAEASSKPVYRVMLNALTLPQVRAAFETPRPLDQNLVEAQHTRRVVDRLVGYLISPLACKALDDRVSIGRLRSVCLRLVVDREREIAAFEPVTAWSLSVKLRAAAGEFTAQLTSVMGQKPQIRGGEQAEQLQRGLTGAAFWVGETRQAEKAWPPPPPFTTATLQQAASQALGLAPEHTMTIAQMLYEAGFITYGCTDTVAVAPEAQAEARQFIAQSYGQAYLPEQPPVYQSRTASTQEAHEAIRPAEVTRLPDSLPPGDGTALYRLIWQRFVASQMTPARYHHSAARILAGKAAGQPYPLDFQARGRTLTFDGFRRVCEDAAGEGEARQPDRMLPPLTDGEPLAVIDWLPGEHTTEPPVRYTEAALVRALEARGIGRPSTYAAMVRLLKDKAYVRLEDERLAPTETGTRLTDFLAQRFPAIFDYEYTALLEHILDQIAAGKVTSTTVLQSFWDSKLAPPLKALASDVAQAPYAPKVLGVCPQCGGKLVERRSAKGTFAGCENFPTCTGKIVRFTKAKKASKA